MFLRTLLFLAIMYFLVRLISYLFLPSDDKKKQQKSNFFYRNFQQFSQQQQSKQNNNQSQSFDEIEEAEFEDITDEENSSSKRSD